MAVFGVYDVLVLRMQSKQKSQEVINRHHNAAARELHLPTTLLPHTDNAPVPLWSHFMTGAISGAVQSLIMSGWEVLTHWASHRHGTKLLRHHMRFGMNHALVARRLVHHSVGYATLFGSYECIRRPLSTARGLDAIVTPATLEPIEPVRRWLASTMIPSVSMPSIGCAFLAGGLAGQLHFVVNHYTMHWKLQAMDPSNAQRKRVHPVRSKVHSVRLLIRASGGSFLPTGLCFVVFQFGGEIVEHVLSRSDV